ncbi:transforming growth factor-beta receptor-associated protein 1-like [Schistocerca gregaria]|uniref:transforming growth factor-beta receptor-associated protein 1-like n=1 Tax=Schistocerca gregaria TaxID=7010 RepID=UPI00211E673F|nr:transforming growth factor-beta receptor-associated protein 1-like [Schistocerca gregaria]
MSGLNIYTENLLLTTSDEKITASVTCTSLEKEKLLYIGTSTGRIVLYMLFWNADSKILESQRIQSIVVDKKKAITELAILGEVGILFSICGRCLNTWNSLSLEPTVSAPKCKNVSKICIYSGEDMTYRICIQRERRLLLYEYVGKFNLLKEIPLLSPVLEIAWSNNVLYLGFKKEYFLFDLTLNQFFLVAAFTTTPLIRRLSPTQMLLKQDQTGLLVPVYDTVGSKKVQTYEIPLKWDSPPNDILTDYPYVISLHDDRKLLEIHSAISWRLIQRIHLLTACNQAERLVPGFSICSSNPFFLVVTDTSILMHTAYDLSIQAEDLVHAGFIDEGIHLATLGNRCGRSDQELSLQLNLSAGWQYLKSLDFKKAFENFEKSSLLPTALLETSFPMLMLEPPASSQASMHIYDLIKSHHTSQPKIEECLKEVFGFVRSFLISSVSKPGVDPSSRATIFTAIFLLSVSLKGSEGDVWECLKTFPEDSLPVEELAKYCTEKEMWGPLALVYRYQKLYDRTLQIWFDINTGKKTDRSLPSNGLEEAISLLETLDDIEVVQKYAEWILSKGEDKLLRVLTSRRRPSRLPFDSVLNCISKLKCETLLEHYLEWLVFDCSVDEEEPETYLANFYLDCILASSVYGDDLAETAVENLSIYRRKLLKLIGTKNMYNKLNLINRMQGFPLYHEKASLWEKVKNHEKALETIVVYLRDINRAEEYCCRYEKEAGEGLFSLLFKLVLHTEEGLAVPTASFAILDKYFTKVKLTNALSMLPSTISVRHLHAHMMKLIRLVSSESRHLSVISQLEAYQNFYTKMKKMQMTAKSILLTNDTLCQVCKKRINEKIFALHRATALIHFSCLKNS